MSNNKSKYAEAGVDIDKGNDFVSRIKPIVASTFRGGVLAGIGGFGGLYALGGDRYKDPVLVSSTDGVGTKLKIANLCKRHDTIGIDLVAMCVNDIVVCGAQPLFFLDYFAVGLLELEVATDVIRGIAEGCRIAKCALIGGETAEMPGMYQAGDYDLAGFVVGIAERDKIIDGSDIMVGNVVIGITSSGLHSNGFSLVRKICFDDLQLNIDDFIEELGCTLGEELLKPTRIYSEPLVKLTKHFKIGGFVHITGGGLVDNIPRVLPNGCKAVIDSSKWQYPPIFQFLQKKGSVPVQEMLKVFNCGIGMVAVVDEDIVDDVIQQLGAMGETAFVIGEIAANKDKSGGAAVEIR
ncbi:MAG: phosphoribosylformylglycinamidine cyclo-ligase [Deltaproteobacteria bacterium RIFOXYD12_FULL_50_9]|nr:MAG: phosphoribosylformylglycinamidine cyclo-ligase [Deltaproteobacteria bacterium RIFOXYD12_FULL_50_9]